MQPRSGVGSGSPGPAQVTLVIPWLVPSEQHLVYPSGVRFEGAIEQVRGSTYGEELTTLSISDDSMGRVKPLGCCDSADEPLSALSASAGSLCQAMDRTTHSARQQLQDHVLRWEI